MRACGGIAWIAVRELLYERVFYLLLCFAVLSLGASLLLGQLTYAEQAKLTLDFMLAGTQIAMAIFSVFMGISLFHRELTLGSVSMVLSKPVSRATFLVGKFIGQSIVQLGVTLGMGLVTIAIVLPLNAALSAVAIFQAVLLIYLEVTVLTAAVYFFAVNAGAITAGVAAGCVFLIGHFREDAPAGRDLAEMGTWQFLKTFLPNFELFNMKDIATYGITLSVGQIGWVGLYGLIATACFLFAACLCFERKDILT